MRKNKRSSNILKEPECRYSVEVLDVKNLSHWVKGDVLISSSSFLCDVVMGVQCCLERNLGGFILNFIISDYISKRVVGREGVSYHIRLIVNLVSYHIRLILASGHNPVDLGSWQTM